MAYRNVHPRPGRACEARSQVTPPQWLETRTSRAFGPARRLLYSRAREPWRTFRSTMLRPKWSPRIMRCSLSLLLMALGLVLGAGAAAAPCPEVRREIDLTDARLARAGTAVSAASNNAEARRDLALATDFQARSRLEIGAGRCLVALDFTRRARPRTARTRERNPDPRPRRVSRRTLRGEPQAHPGGARVRVPFAAARGHIVVELGIVASSSHRPPGGASRGPRRAPRPLLFA